MSVGVVSLITSAYTYREGVVTPTDTKGKEGEILLTLFMSHGDITTRWPMVVKLELINEQGEKVQRQMRVIERRVQHQSHLD
jgi:hypothetical protein